MAEKTASLSLQGIDETMKPSQAWQSVSSRTRPHRPVAFQQADTQSQSSRMGSHGLQAPPHMRGQGTYTEDTGTSYGTSSYPSSVADSADTEAYPGKPPIRSSSGACHPAYTAYGPQGQQSTRYMPQRTDTSDTASTIASTTQVMVDKVEGQPRGGGAWAKPVSCEVLET